MCAEENNAQHAIVYLNAQLQSLWRISSECVEHHGTYMKPEPIYRYSFALAEWYFGRHSPGSRASIQDMMFHARFQAPRLDFLCNHEALLKINIEEGHFNLDYTRATEESTAARSQNQVIAPSSTVTFRVPFKMTGIKGRDSKISNGEVTVNMVVLDLRSATLNSITPLIHSGRQAVEIYLQKYLCLLQSAGHHVLFSLPTFDDEARPPYLDFSQAAYRLLGIESVHGVSIDQINRYLSMSWLKAAVLINSQLVDRPAISLVECRSTWAPHDGDAYFHLNFGAPHVAALCDEEILVSFVVNSVRFYKNGDFENGAPFKVYKDWKVAVLMNIIHETEDDGNITRCKLDLASALFMQQFSEFEGCDFEGDGEDSRCMNQVIDFISGEYLNILENGQHYVIYYHNARSPKPEERVELNFVGEAEWASTETVGVGGHEESGTIAWRDMAQNSDMCGFDQIIALSQFSLNTQFFSAWREQECITSMAVDKTLSRWRYQDRFEAAFKPMTIQLRANGRVVVCVHLKEGLLRLLGDLSITDREMHSFSDWRVAFEGDLKMYDHESVSGTSPEWATRFAQTAACKQHGDNGEIDFKHICLDLQRVEFLYEASRFEGLFTSNSSRSMDKVLATVTYLRDHYLKRFVELGHHVLYTIPVWRNPAIAPSHGLTSVAFHVHAKPTIPALDSLATQPVPHASSPAIMILGMCGGRSPPGSVISSSREWIVHAGNLWSHGTGSLSSTAFLQERLLPLFSEVNAATTIFPTSSSIEQDRWRLDVGSWMKFPQHKVGDCPFDAAENEDGVLRYQWQYQDRYNFDVRDGGVMINGVYSLFSSTMNYLEIPTTFTGGAMEIKLGGRVELELGANTMSSWDSKGSASWTASLSAYTEAGVLRVRVFSAPTQFHKELGTDNTSQSALALQPQDLLKKALPGTMDLSAVVKEFKAFENSWQSCYPRSNAYSAIHPVFNRNGDLLFELHARAPTPPALPRTASGPPRSPRQTSIRGRGAGTANARTPARPASNPTFPSSPPLAPSPSTLRVDANASSTRSPLNNNGSFTEETTTFSEGAFSGSPFGLFSMGSPMSSATSMGSASSHLHAQFEQAAEEIRKRTEAAAAMHQRPASATRFRPSSRASDHLRSQFSSTFTVADDGFRVQPTSSQPEIATENPSRAHTPKVQPFTTSPIPDIHVHIAEALGRAGMSSSGGFTTTTTTTTTHRSTTPQIRTVRPIPINIASSGSSAIFREHVETSGEMTGGMMGGMTMGEMFDDLPARFRTMEVRSSTPLGARTVFSSMTSGGSSSSTSMSSEEHFRSSSRSDFRHVRM